jgi:hypothetical protein
MTHRWFGEVMCSNVERASARAISGTSPLNSDRNDNRTAVRERINAEVHHAPVDDAPHRRSARPPPGNFEHDPESVSRFSLATNAEGVCAEVTRKQKDKRDDEDTSSRSRVGKGALGATPTLFLIDISLAGLLALCHPDRPSLPSREGVKKPTYFVSTYFPSFTVKRMRERSSRP